MDICFVRMIMVLSAPFQRKNFFNILRIRSTVIEINVKFDRFRNVRVYIGEVNTVFHSKGKTFSKKIARFLICIRQFRLSC